VLEQDPETGSPLPLVAGPVRQRIAPDEINLPPKTQAALPASDESSASRSAASRIRSRHRIWCSLPESIEKRARTFARSAARSLHAQIRGQLSVRRDELEIVRRTTAPEQPGERRADRQKSFGCKIWSALPLRRT